MYILFSLLYRESKYDFHKIRFRWERTCENLENKPKKMNNALKIVCDLGVLSTIPDKIIFTWVDWKVVLRFITYYRCLSFFFWPLSCLSFDLRFLITLLASFGHWVVCPLIYGFWLPFQYLLCVVLHI
jgi:hypothetical protein